MNKFNLPLIASIIASLAGIAGTVITPFLGATVDAQVQAILQALSALLVVIPTWHVSSVAATQAKVKMGLKP